MSARSRGAPASSETKRRLVDGTRRCVVERGAGATTARDISAATGTNLAAINYHFGSKDALVTLALVRSVDACRDRVARAAGEAAAASPAERVERLLEVLRQVLVDDRGTAVAGVQALAAAEHAGPVRAEFARSHEQLRADLAQLVLHAEEVSDETARGVGSTALALVHGFALQWLLDPATAPAPQHCAAALTALASG